MVALLQLYVSVGTKPDPGPSDGASPPERGSAPSSGQPKSGASQEHWHGSLVVSSYAVDLDATPPDRKSNDASRDIGLGFSQSGVEVYPNSFERDGPGKPTAKKCAGHLQTEGVEDHTYDGAGTEVCVETTNGRTAVVKLGKATTKIGGDYESVRVTVTVWGRP